MALGHQHVVEALRYLGLVVDPEDLSLVHALQVEAHRALLGVDLEAVVVLAAGGEAGALQRADGAVLELHGRGEGVVHVHDAGAAVTLVALLDESLGQGRHALDAAHQVVRQVDDVRAQVAQRAAAGHPSASAR
jgi:hypothetical protein